MQRGEQVEVVEAFAGKQLKTVVAWNDKYIYVCRNEEYKAAKEEDREPQYIGFPREFVKEIRQK